MVRKQQQKRNSQNMQPDTASDSSTALVDNKELEELVSRAVKTEVSTLSDLIRKQTELMKKRDEEIQKIECRISALEEQINRQDYEINEAEQYSRKTSVRIRGQK